MRPTWRVLCAGVCGSLLLLALIWRPAPVPPAWAQGVGIYSRPNCSTLTGAVSGATVCWDSTLRGWKVYDGAKFATVSTINGYLLNVKDFGAKGDGATDDTTAIQSAFNSLALSTAGATVVYFPVGDYIIAGTVTIPVSQLSGDSVVGGLTVLGAGPGITTIRTPGTGNTMFSASVASGAATQFNLTFEGFSAIANSTLYNAFHITTQNISRVIVKRVNFWSQNTSVAAVAGLQLNGNIGGGGTSFYALVEDCLFTGSSIAINGVSDSWITNNIIFPQVGSAGRGYGINLIGLASEIRIQGNHLGAAANGAIYSNGSNIGSLGIQHNFFDTASLNTASAINLTSVSNAAIVGNTFFAIPSYGIVAQDLSTSAIVGNAFLNTPQTSGIGSNAILLATLSTGSTRNTITGNAFLNASGITPAVAAINEAAGSSGTMIVGNTFNGAGYTTPAVSLTAASETVANTNVGWTLGAALTPQGIGTLNYASATFSNGKPASVASATGQNLLTVRGISATQSIANNLRGSCTFAAASTCAVAFASNEPDAAYFIALGPQASAAANVHPYGVTSKAVSGFTITATVSNSNTVDWILIR